MIKRNANTFSLIFLFLVLAACTQASPTPAFNPTETVLPLTSVPSPIPTELSTATHTIAPTQTVTVIPTRDLSAITVLGAGPSNGWYLLNFNLLGVNQAYLLTVDGIPFKCQILAQYGDRLSCTGPMLPWGKKVTFQFTDPSTGQMRYQMEYTLPAFDYEFGKAVEPPCVDQTTCPDRGKNFWCETEIRQSDHGYCMVSSCSDECGFCVGIDTCHAP
jgi:hypothetical protein